ncbi:MAG: septum site-determining protein MinC [Oscillatoria sp. PMC 1051.18]|uniref:septum site-determining protein MinC n=1 Tax=Oscillatoria salina TaxID=331517 RepID=UPI0013B89B7D|nr:septum site-determining protein MinC [Oscillatoria salina]MBZ8179889.1 septum site-determining protein MinC [Oscillatoria salina IIICB1]MEC4891976.1 septum site-determining protein MinC [Oscillatoria sp. PMC 1050.18]MEC5028602.1 septum site-determining protein MinC [Oscillatoria sp. PMC 1051.18]NET87436.1 septum site-determining protein MinC [Kamptonema sp. SIO1D9]
MNNEQSSENSISVNQTTESDTKESEKTNEESISLTELTDELLETETPRKLNPFSQLRLKQEGSRMKLILPTEAQTPVGTDWSEVWLELKQRLNGQEPFWQPETEVILIAQDRLVDARQLQAIADALDEFQLRLKRVETSRRQTAVAGATAGYSVEQVIPAAPLTAQPETNPEATSEPLYLKTTVRSGVEVRHPGTVIVMGDLNPGGTIIATGDIIVWGRLRGITHAGASGNRECQIMALQMEPTQLRIADAVARAPAKSPDRFDPEIAYVTAEGIRIKPAMDAMKSYSFSK